MASSKKRSKRKTTKQKKSQSRIAEFFKNIVPVSAQAFIARRIVDIIAISMVGMGIVTIVAMASFDQTDPSLNTVTTDSLEIHNYAGPFGALISDLLMQTVGIMGYALGIGAVALGVRIMARQRIRPLILRGISLVIALVTGAVALSLAFIFDWISMAQPGGSFGYLGRRFVEEIALNSVVRYAVFGFFAIVSIASFLYAAACSWREIGAVLRTIFTVILGVIVGVIRTLIGIKNWIAHYNEPDYQAKPFMPNISLPSLRLPAVPSLSIKRNPNDFEIVDTTNDIIPPSEAYKQSSSALITTPETSIPVVQSKQAPPKTPSPNQQKLNLEVHGEWEYPPISLIETPPPPKTQGRLDETALRRNAELLQNVLADYGVEGEITSIRPGPVVTLYELEPAAGVKSSKVINLSDDIARSMAALSVRCSVVPGRSVIGIEIPNKTRQIVYLQDQLNSKEFTSNKKALPIILGHDIGGKPTLADLSKMPHLLVAGTTGSGKSVAVNTMILSLLYAMSPDQCRFIMIDPKMLELSVYADIPHLLSPVVTEAGKAVVALKWAVAEMEERYRAMSKIGVRNLAGYNERMREAQKNGETIMTKIQTGFDPETGKGVYEEQPMDLSELPLIVIVVDEFADLMLVAGKDVENAIQRLAQMARAAGIHLIMATQRPSVDVITGVIKANFPTRISFQVTSKIDSRTILGEGGAEQLLGMGDMLFMAPGGKIQRVHGPFVSDSDVEKVVDFIKAQRAPDYIKEVTEGGDFGDNEVMNAMFGSNDSGEKVDELYDEAVAVIAREGKASTSFIQRHLQIGYNRAARIIEEMERQGVVSKASSSGKREVLVSDHSDVA